jgi:hypothetical protein
MTGAVHIGSWWWWWGIYFYIYNILILKCTVLLLNINMLFFSTSASCYKKREEWKYVAAEFKAFNLFFCGLEHKVVAIIMYQCLVGTRGRVLGRACVFTNLALVAYTTLHSLLLVESGTVSSVSSPHLSLHPHGSFASSLLLHEFASA